jgi:WD40-like Beta Propeller Repeat
MIARRLTLAVLVSVSVFACVLVASAGAATAAPLFGPLGHEAGQIYLSQGMAIDHATGDVYVSDIGNERIDKFDGSGKFVLAWGWGVANGAQELQTCTTSCQAGHEGTGAGELCLNSGVAVDNDPLSGSYGDVYVTSFCGNEVEKFDPSGKFLLAFGGHVNETTGGNVCLAGEACKSGTQGTANGEFEWEYDRSYIAVGSGGAVYVGDKARVQIFDPSGAWKENISLSGLSSTGKVTALAVDSTGDVYVADSEASGVREFEPGGVEKSAQLDEGSTSVQAIALDASGNLFVADTGGGAHFLKYDPSGKELESFGSRTLTLAFGAFSGMVYDEASEELYVYGTDGVTEEPGLWGVFGLTVPPPGPLVEPGESATPGLRGTASLEATVNPEGNETTYRYEYVDQANFQASGYASASSTPTLSVGSSFGDQLASVHLTGLVPGGTYHYRIVATSSKGTATGPDQSFTTIPPALIDGPWAANVASTSATLAARINPLGASTEYRLEWGTSTSYGHTHTGNVGEGMDYVVVNYHPQGLEAGTTYHYRVVTTSEVGTIEGTDHTFTTQHAGGQELSLLDGRAWELVSPSNKNGALIEDYGGVPVQAASDGSGISYGASEAIGENPEGKTFLSQILSTRGPDGWKSQDISLPHSLAKEEELSLYGYEYQLFSPDLSLAAIWQQATAASPLAPEAADGKLYLRDDTDGSFLPLFTTANIPPGTNLHEEVGEGATKVEFATATPDLSHVIFASRLVLTSEAIEGSRESPDGTIPQQMNLYEWSAGRFQPINVLPGEITTEKTVPGANIGGSTVYGNIPRAVSSDGRWVVWTLGEPYYGEPSSLYVRDMVEKRTVQIGGDDARVLAMSSDGSKIFFLEGSTESGFRHIFQGGELYEFDTATGVQTALTSDHGPGESSAGVKEGLLGTSEDGSWVYFMANGVLGDGAERGATTGNCMLIGHKSGGEGSCNLYVWHDGTTKYITRLSSEDEFDWYYEAFGGAQQLGPVRSRVSPDGRYLTFMSNGSLTGYDNSDANSGEPDEEVYMYDAVTDRLVCASCDPTGARPVGISGSTHILMEDRTGPGSLQGHWLAGVTPTSQENLHFKSFHQPRYLSDTGRLFFDSPDALVPQDTNGLMDAYEYEPAGVGSCTAVSITFSERSGGCVSLVSSGTSSQESAFYDASENGDDAFFLTASRLSAADYDTSLDVYDAHVCSTAVPCVAVPVSPPPCTSGDSCKAAPSPQPDIFGPPPSATFNGAGNVVASPVGSVVKPKSLTRAQKLALALKACRREGARRRAVCERQVRKRYAVKRSRKANAKKKGGRR